MAVLFAALESLLEARKIWSFVKRLLMVLMNGIAKPRERKQFLIRDKSIA
ncbi:hypothetical protein [Bartonella saheliensis]|nr:hypothetical protein [Bartonella saheliensis]